MSPEEAAARNPLLVAAAFYVAGDATAVVARLRGRRWTLVLGSRTGYGDHEARARTENAPGFLTEAAGIWYDEFGNVSSEVPVQAGPDSLLSLDPDAAGTRWIDGVIDEDANVLAGYAGYVHPHFGQWAAITTHLHGRGRVTYIGTVPHQSLASSIFRWLVPEPARRMGVVASLCDGDQRDRRGRESCAPPPQLVLGRRLGRDDRKAPGPPERRDLG